MAGSLALCRRSHSHTWQGGVSRWSPRLATKGWNFRWHRLERGCFVDHVTALSLCCLGYCQCFDVVGYLLLIRFTSVDF